MRKPNKKKPYCSRCKEKKPDVRFAPTALGVEIYGDNTPVWMCQDCRNRLAEEI